jgi:hypothetical protein
MDEFLGDDPRDLREVSLRPGASELAVVHLPDGEKVYFELTAEGRLEVSVKHGRLVIRPAACDACVLEVESHG